MRLLTAPQPPPRGSGVSSERTSLCPFFAPNSARLIISGIGSGSTESGSSAAAMTTPQQGRRPGPAAADARGVARAGFEVEALDAVADDDRVVHVQDGDDDVFVRFGLHAAVAFYAIV